MRQDASVLVVEDDPDDILLLTLAFRKTSLPWRIIHVASGNDAIKCLNGSGPYGNRDVYPLPRLILLDIKMPLFDGFEFLEWLRSRDDLRELPAVVISSSGQEVDKVRARNLGAREYHVKPADPEHFTRLLLELHQRWLKTDTSFLKKPEVGGRHA